MKVVVNFIKKCYPNNIKLNSESIFLFLWKQLGLFRSSPPEVFLRKGVLKICSKFTGEHPCRSVISIKFQSNFIKIALRFSCKIAACFQKTFSSENIWWAASDYSLPLDVTSQLEKTQKRKQVFTGQSCMILTVEILKW